METTLAGPKMPRFRDGVRTSIGANVAEVAFGDRRCTFEFSESDAIAISRLFEQLKQGGLSSSDLVTHTHEIAAHIPQLLADFDDLRLLTESHPASSTGAGACSGAQLYREVRRLAERTVDRVAKSSFYRALEERRATRAQLVGYALEYYWIVMSAPGLIGPALGMAHCAAERTLLQNFLKSELGHDRFLAVALKAVGVTSEELALHQPLPATFALCASLGVYARQHPLSFKACLFLFERAQPAFIDAFDDCCRALGLPDAFHTPLRAHADLNDQYDHEDISRALMEIETVVDAEACAVVKRHVSIMIETMIQQEEQILSFYGQQRERIPRIFE
ncbi:MAG: iron-containing redox enzyme family protein [Collimonas pratensis]|uniref:iron-containing redox enzyme family protein n=1 Tax=Collimonas pratensis TaxID=279113 RepID=UPI003C74294F